MSTTNTNPFDNHQAFQAARNNAELSQLEDLWANYKSYLCWQRTMTVLVSGFAGVVGTLAFVIAAWPKHAVILGIVAGCLQGVAGVFAKLNGTFSSWRKQCKKQADRLCETHGLPPLVWEPSSSSPE